MALVKQILPLSLDQGINTKFDQKDLPFGQFELVQNASYIKTGEFDKRFGYEKIKGETIGGTLNEPVIGVSKFKNQLLWVSRDQVYSYSEGVRVFQNEGSYDAVVPESNVVVQNRKEQSQLQCAFMENYNVFVYMEGSAHKISVVDNVSGSYVTYNTTVPSSTRTGNLRLAVADQKIYLFGTDGSRVLKYQVFDLLGYLRDGLAFDATGAFGSEQTVVTLASDQRYDVASSSLAMIIAYYDSSASELRFARKPAGSATVTTNIDPFSVAITPHDAIDLSVDPFGKFILATANGSGVVKFAILGADCAQLKAPVTVEDVTSSGFHSIRTITAVSVDGLDYQIFYQVYQINPTLYNINAGTTGVSTQAELKNTWSQYHVRKSTYAWSTSTAGTASTIMRGVGLATKAFIQDQNAYINVIRETELFATYYTAKNDGSIQAKISQNSGGSLLNSTRKRQDGSTMFSNYSGTNVNANYTIPSLSDVPQITTEKFLFTSKIQGIIESGTEGNTSYYSLYGVNSSILDFSNEIVNQTEELAENLNFSGGQIKAYDGNVLVEQNFNYPAEFLIEGALAAGTSTNYTFQKPASTGDTDVYYYKAIYSWTDAQGNIHRSGPSAQFSWSYAGTSGVAYILSAEIIIPSLNLTQKEDVYVELYRTTKNGTLFYRLNGDNETTKSQTFDPIVNQPTADFMSFLDKTTDAVLINNEVIYTTGGELENTSPPSCSVISSFKNRLFLAGLENKLELRFSKLLSSKVGVEFNDTLSILVSQVGGDITALKTMDDKLIIFKENAIFYLSGDGPNNLGQQDTFIEPQLISSDMGCSVKNSVVLTPAGIFFKSHKGIHVLSRSLQLNYVGAALEDYNHLTITKGDIYPKDNEVRYLTSDGQALVFNYFRGFWSIFSNHKGDSSVVIGSDYYYVHKDGNGSSLYKQSTNYDDAGSPIELAFETGWINPFVKQGAMRIYRMLILGEYFSPHQLKVSIAYNYDDYYSQSKVINVTDYTEVFDYGKPGLEIKSTGVEKGYYGDPGGTTGSFTTAIAYGGKDVMQYQVRVDFDQQKCEAFKIKIETEQQGGENKKGATISDISFVVGNKGTDYKIKQGRIFGTN